MLVDDADNGQQKNDEFWQIGIAQTLHLRQHPIHVSFIGGIQQIRVVNMLEHGPKISIHHQLSGDERRDGDQESRIHARID